MKLVLPGYRPAVIDEELYTLLNGFRGFRHVFRHAYTFELDWERERLVATRLERTAALLHEQVEAFLEGLADPRALTLPIIDVRPSKGTRASG